MPCSVRVFTADVDVSMYRRLPVRRPALLGKASARTIPFAAQKSAATAVMKWRMCLMVRGVLSNVGIIEQKRKVFGEQYGPPMLTRALAQ